MACPALAPISPFSSMFATRVADLRISFGVERFNLFLATESPHYEQIKECFPKQRKPAKISNLDVLNAVLYVVENGGKWRSLPKEYGDWHVIYVRINRWAKKGVLEKAFLRLQQLGIIKIQVNVVSLDSTCIKVHPDGMGALKKTERKPSEEHVVGGTPNFIWSPHLIEMG